MYTISSQTQRPTGMLGLMGLRFTPGLFGTGAAMLLVMGALHMVPWQADEAASRGLAQLLNSGPPRTLAALTAAQPNLTRLMVHAEPSKPALGTTARMPMAAAADPKPEAPAAVAMTAAPTVEKAAPVAANTAPVVETQTIALQSGKTLAAMLQELGMVAEEAKAAMGAVRDVFDVRRLKAGQEFEVTVRKTGNARNLLGLNFLAEPTRQITITRDASGTFDADAVKVPTERKRVAATGAINGGLYDAAQDAGVPINVVRDVVKMFAHTVDFQRDIKAGDEFRIIYNQDVTKNGDKVGDGEVVYAAIESGGKMKQLYRYEYDKGQYDFFDETGKSARRALLRTPIDNPRITSGFGTRVHPVLGFSKMHEGVDFGAATGTPIYAAGDGVVEQAGWFGSYGRFVKLRHTNQLETAYGHMSNIAKGLNPGDKVRQGQLIGYVGTTGRSTGPHLHYETIINDRKINPLGVNIDAGRSLSGKQLNVFKAWQQKLQADFNAQTGDKGGDKPVKPVKLASR